MKLALGFKDRSKLGGGVIAKTGEGFLKEFCRTRKRSNYMKEERIRV
jgi:hypothetical protein